MNPEEVKAQLLWMLANRPGYYMWIGWLRSLPEEHQAWVREQLPLVRTVVELRKYALMWEGFGEWARNVSAILAEAVEKVMIALRHSSLRPALEMIAELYKAAEVPTKHRWVLAKPGGYGPFRPRVIGISKGGWKWTALKTEGAVGRESEK